MLLYNCINSPRLGLRQLRNVYGLRISARTANLRPWSPCYIVLNSICGCGGIAKYENYMNMPTACQAFLDFIMLLTVNQSALYRQRDPCHRSLESSPVLVLMGLYSLDVVWPCDAYIGMALHANCHYVSSIRNDVASDH
jgi:hypothetical protein